MLSSQIPNLYLSSTSKGRGVFTAGSIPRDSIIEICPVIIMSNDERQMIHKTSLHDYYFIWDLETKSCAIALGYGSLYNHSEEPNAAFEINKDDKEIQIKAIADIPPGEEILIKYIGDGVEEFGLWF